MCDFNLIFVQLTVLILFLSLLLKRDDDKAHKDVHHEESHDDDVDDEEDGDLHSVVVDRAHVLSARVDGFIQQPGEQEDQVSLASHSAQAANRVPLPTPSVGLDCQSPPREPPMAPKQTDGRTDGHTHIHRSPRLPPWLALDPAGPAPRGGNT